MTRPLKEESAPERGLVRSRTRMNCVERDVERYPYTEYDAFLENGSIELSHPTKTNINTAKKAIPNK
jgi:hypothetical protein